MAVLTSSAGLAAPSSLRSTAVAYLSALVVAEAVTRATNPTIGTACYMVVFVGLVNLAVVRTLRSPEDAAAVWPLLAVAALPVLERMLTLAMPPLRWDPVRAYALWSVPLLAAALTVRRRVLGDRDEYRTRLLPPETAGRRLPALGVQALLALGGLALGAVAGLIAAGGASALGGIPRLSGAMWIGMAALVFAGCVQEFSYRTVVVPVATAAAGRAGAVAASLFMAATWTAWLGVRVMAPVVVVALGYAFAVWRWRATLGAIVGHGLFMLAMALLWPGVLL